MLTSTKSRRASHEPLRVALIGYGLGGQAFHAPFVATTPGMKLATIVTANPERRAQARKDFPDAAIVDSPQEIWSRALDHELVVIVTSNRSHVPLALAAIDVGIPVVIDKPLAANIADAKALVARAEQAGVPLSVYHERRWDGEFLTARRLIEDGALGEVLRFESRLDRWRPQPRAGAWRELADPTEAGGLLFDLGSHLIDQALLLFGRVTHVYAELECRRAGSAVPDDVFIALRHAQGTLSHLWASAVAAQAGPRLRVMGSRAAYVKNFIDVQEQALRSGILPNAPGFGEDPEAQWGRLGSNDDSRPIKTELGDYKHFYSSAVGWLRNGGPPPVDPNDAIAGLEIIAAAQRSAAEQRVIAVVE